jgi:peroxiredoxin
VLKWSGSLGLLGFALSCATACSKPGTEAAGGPAVSHEVALAEAELPSAPLVAGSIVNDFRALGHTGERVRLSRYLKKPVLVYFCPQDNAPACVQLATGLRDQWLKLNSQLGMVFGVSPEDMQVHSAYGAEHKLPFLMLADGTHQLEKTFGLGSGNMVSFLVGSDRKILRVFSPPAGIQHATEVIKALTDLGLAQPSDPI